MTPDELASLNEIGHDVVQAFAAITCETLLLTIYGVFVLKSLLLVRQSAKRRAGGYLLAMTILTMFATAIVLWTLDIANFIMEAKITLIENSEDPIGAKLLGAHAFVSRLEAVQDVLYAYMALLGDAIIIHRVWKLQAFSGRLWALLVPCAILFGSFVATVMLTVCIGELGFNIDAEQQNFKSPVCANVQIISFIMPSANTAIATILIGVTAWKYRKSIAPIFRDNVSIGDNATKPKPTQIEKILVLLLESGILYFLFFVSQVVIASPPINNGIKSRPGLAFASKIYTYCTSVIVGLYPTILLVLARSKHNVLDRAAASSGATSLPSLRIARRYTDFDRDRTPTFQISRIGMRSADEPELDSLPPMSPHDEEKGERITQ
ncbi:hypothetical protein C8R45DRAFT_1044189 [Mycena sanguinolenta]|nr:hypothetical protein C8R45DRAFT_1044189 [Mycena sanguinolenta]